MFVFNLEAIQHFDLLFIHKGNTQIADFSLSYPTQFCSSVNPPSIVFLSSEYNLVGTNKMLLRSPRAHFFVSVDFCCFIY